MELEDYKILMKSFRLYQLSLLTYSLDIGLAYSLLVSSVDTISCKLYENMEINGKKAGSKAKFVKFIEDYLPPEFWVSFDSRALEEDRYYDNIENLFPLTANMPRTPKLSILDHEREMYEKQGKASIEHLKHILSDSAITWLVNAFEKKEELPAKEKEAYEHVIRHWYLYRADEKLGKDELSASLSNIYGSVRSAFFHMGESPSHSAIDNHETAKLKFEVTKEHKVVYQRDIPAFYWFERVAHDSILNYFTKIPEIASI